jgi:uncharacterized protein
VTYQTALITGASSGIGAAFAEALAAEGSDLILVARSKDKLETLAERLKKQHGRRVEVIAADLAEPSPGARIAAAVAKLGMNVDLLLNNAGFGTAGAFHRSEPQRNSQMVALNVAAVVDLTHAFLPAMLERGSGAIVNVASVAAFQPTPTMSVYGATKAFVLSFSEGLWAEYRRKGLKVLAVCPGPTDTPFFEASGTPNLRKTVPPAMMMRVEDVVQDALRALKAGRTVAVPGLLNKALTSAPRLMPRRLMAVLSGKAMGR